MLPPPAAGEGAISAADMAPGGDGSGGGAGGGSGGGVLHFVGSRCGELGTNSNQREAQRGVHLNGLRPAYPREKEPGAPGSAAGWGRTLRPGAGSQLSARPSPKWRMRASLARLLPRTGHGTNARSFEDRERAAARLARWSRSALFTHPSLPRRGRERARYPPCSSSRDQSVSTTRSSVPRGERLLCAQGAGFQRLAPFPVGSWSLPRDQPEGQPSSRAAQESLKGCPLSLNKPLMRLANNFHVWERREIFYHPLSQQYI